MLHRTGPGKISVDVRYAGPGMIKALLYNFDIDGDTVKPEHIAFLQSKVVPLLQGDRGHIWMQGSTSKSGSNQYNIKLSKQRVNNIASVLRAQGIFDRQMQLDAVGEEQAQAHAMEDESDRAVALVVIPVARESPPPPKKIPPPPPVSKIEAQTARVNDLIAKWKAYRMGISEPDRYLKIMTDLYQVRNPDWRGNPSISVWPAHLIDADDGIMAAVEHYFLCRGWVGNAVYPVWQVRAMNFTYDMGKLVGVAPRHNPNKPPTPLTVIQMSAKEAGIRDGEMDLAKSGKTAPLVKKPPKYW